MLLKNGFYLFDAQCIHTAVVSGAKLLRAAGFAGYRVSDDGSFTAQWSPANLIGGAENSVDLGARSGGKVHGAAVITEEKTGLAEEGGQLTNI